MNVHNVQKRKNMNAHGLCVRLMISDENTAGATKFYTSAGPKDGLLLRRVRTEEACSAGGACLAEVDCTIPHHIDQ